VALQGTIDAFPLTDVLQLLSSSSKSGRLLLEGDRGRAELWIEAGSVVGGAANGATTGAALLVFEMLRFADGSFVFDAIDGAPPVAVTPAELAECVPAAAELLEEWVRIEAVVPSMAHGIAIAPELAEDAVTVGADEWRIVAAAGDSPSVGDLAARLGLDEFSTCAALADLVARALLVVTEPRVSVAGPAPEAAPETPFTVEDDRGSLDAPPAPEVVEAPAEEETFPERFPIDDLLGGAEENDGPWVAQDDEGHRFAAAQTFEPLGAESFGEPAVDEHLPDRTAEAWDEVVSGQSPVEEPWQELPMDPADQQAADETADEVLRQMSRLSPKAAEAIAAALSGPASTTPVSHDTTGERRDNDGPVTFMGSF
jgi:hypothetical protein